MALAIRPSDLKYRYPRVVETRHLPKFQGKDDPMPFNRNDLYDIIPILEAVMDELGAVDGRVLHLIEDLLNQDMPRFIQSRREVFEFLTCCTRDVLDGA